VIDMKLLLVMKQEVPKFVRRCEILARRSSDWMLLTPLSAAAQL
jgi:hypothetical protein